MDWLRSARLLLLTARFRECDALPLAAGLEAIIVHLDVQTNDAGLATGKREHSFAASAHEDRRIRLLKGFGEGFQVGHTVVFPSKSDRLLREELFDDNQRLF